jgi:hypothetical protein
MKKFIFNDITIHEAFARFINDIGQEYELQNGKPATISGVSDMQAGNYSETNLDAFVNADFLPNGEMDIAKIQKAGRAFLGFQVTVTTKPTERGNFEQWYERIVVPIEFADKKTNVETDHPLSLIHNKE